MKTTRPTVTAAPNVTMVHNGRFVATVHLDEYGPAGFLCLCEHASEAEAWMCPTARAAASRWGISADMIDGSRRVAEEARVSRALRDAARAFARGRFPRCAQCSREGDEHGYGCSACAHTGYTLPDAGGAS